MLTWYFSGTGNTAFIARRFSELTGAECRSIEEPGDHRGLFAKHGTLAFCYPVYGSSVPAIVRDFVRRYIRELDGKRLIVLCTQLLFSGDGARAFADLLDGIDYRVVYAEHIRMPNNICNFALLPLTSETRMLWYRERAEAKLSKIAADIEQGRVHRRGFALGSKLLGFLTQRAWFQSYERNTPYPVKVSDACIRCGDCVRACPTGNLFLADGAVRQRGQCSLCYRCVNLCPAQAITVMIHTKVKRQYEGFRF